MLTNQIYLFSDEETVSTEARIPFACTNKFFAHTAELNCNPQALIDQISQMHVFLVMKEKSGRRGLFSILTDEVVLTCVLSEENYLVITRVRRKSIKIQNLFLRYSIKLVSAKGAVLWKDNQILSNTPGPDTGEAIRQFNIISDGLTQLLWQEEEGNTDDQDQVESTEEDDWEEEYEDEFEEEDHLERLLDQAEFYNLAEDELQQIAAQSGSQLYYSHRESVSDHTRVEKVAYRFLFDEYDKRAFKKNTKVVVELGEGTRISGSISHIEEDVAPVAATVLFEEKFNDADLSEVGLLSLDYNPIQREVREAVIEDIRKGTSKAQYFQDAIGTYTCLPYANKDVSDVISRLRAMPYPPNESQIDAIVKGIQSQDVLLVLGPPGTGKTTVILEWVKYFVKTERKRVLISSQNNKAVDNVLERLAEESGIEIIRVGNEDKVQSNVQHLMFEKRTYELQQRITSAVQKHFQYMDSDEQLLDQHQQRVVLAQACWGEYTKSRDQLQGQYNEITQAHLPALQEIHQQYTSTVEQVTDLSDQLQELLNGIGQYEQANKLMKIISYPAQHLRKKRLVQLHEQYRTGQLAEAELTERYNRLYDQLLNTLEQEAMIQLKARWHSADSEWRVLRDLLQSDISLQSYLPDIAQPVLEGDDDRVRGELQACLQETIRRRTALGRIREAVQQWQMYLQMKKNYALAQVVLDAVDLVGATCIGINSQQRFQDIEFDVTIIDEAGQIQIHNAIVPMSRSSKVIMLGDHLQIPPIEDPDIKRRCEENSVDASLLSMSFFEYLYQRFEPEHKVLLDTQYRMPGEIADLLSEWFYEGQYKSFSGKRGMETVLPALFNSPFAVVTTSDSSRRMETKVKNEGSSNSYEAELAVQLLELALSTVNPDTLNPKSRKFVTGGRNFQPEEIGIITPYNAQVKVLRDLVGKRIPGLRKETIGELVASLDSFQGQERPIILYSCVRSNSNAPSRERIGFIKELRRLNVALSRCQQQLILIGDLDFFAACEYEDPNQLNEDGKPRAGTSEKEFAAFMQLLLSHLQQGNGQLMPSEQVSRQLQHVKGVSHE